jgi:sulfate adenylyltransferase
MITSGAYSPLKGFMTAQDYRSTIEEMRLESGTLWPMPVVFALPVALEDHIDEVHLTKDGRHCATLLITESYRADLEREAQRVYGTTSLDHPGVRAIYEQGSFLYGGHVELHHSNELFEHPRYLTPDQTRAAFVDRGWKTIVAFQTRNPVHRAHEYLHKVALESIDGLLLHPLVGATKDDDVPAEVRMEAYEVLLEHYYPQDRVVLGVYPAAMRYGGPREAVLHALSRKNYGCTHFIVGRDHAGVGSYYETYAAQQIFDNLDPKEIGIEILRFEHSFYCTRCEQVVSVRTCPHGGDAHLTLSGTKVRELLRSGLPLPKEFSRPEVAEVLRRAYNTDPQKL